MKVTQVSLRPTLAAEQAGRPSLTPELLAASGARYSRNNEGLEAILEKIDPENLDKSVDGIFRMIDYGHQSIADMAPVAMFMDNISIWLAYYTWSLCPTAGGQESSTRYIQLDLAGLPDAKELGIPEDQQDEWRAAMEKSFATYQSCYDAWTALAEADPSITRIPREVIEDTSEKGKKKLARMQRNFAFDRARYYLPCAAATNVMMIMSARAWVQLAQHLLSYPLPEAKRLGGLIRDELPYSAPRLLKHAVSRESTSQGLDREFARWRDLASEVEPKWFDASNEDAPGCDASLTVDVPEGVEDDEIIEALKSHDNRYAWFGSALERTGVRFSWTAMAVAEIRDLNRHRTGSKYCPYVPQGFYGALDELPQLDPECSESKESEVIRQATKLGRDLSGKALQYLKDGDSSYVYWTLLGTQFPFEHTTTADKFIYEAELRTGIGAHYRYAEHLRDTLQLWYEQFPETRGMILEGSAEPE